MHRPQQEKIREHVPDPYILERLLSGYYEANLGAHIS